MDDDLIRTEATRLGVDTSFTDVHGVTHAAEIATLRVVVEALTAGRGPGSEVMPPVHLLPRRSLHAPRGALQEQITGAGRILDARLRLQATPGMSDRAQIVLDRSADATAVLLPHDLPVGCHTLDVDTTAGAARVTVIQPPASMSPHTRVPVPPWVGGSAVFAPTYALWDTSSPLASYGALGRLAEGLGALGVDLLATLPLYAMFLDEPCAPSPYSPISRLHWNEVLISEHLADPAGTAGTAPADITRLTRDGGRYVDWVALGARRRTQLRHRAATLDNATLTALQSFVAARPDVTAYARFMAERAHAQAAHHSNEPTVDLGVDLGVEMRSHELAQYLAHTELEAIAQGPGAQLALDLPVGCHPDGFERWAYPGLFAEGMSIGAPPDLLFDGGQDWGLPPMLPEVLRASGYQLWRDLVIRAGEHAALVRIDHVMALHRLWWIPAGMESHQGVYVRYPRTEMFAMLAATAAAVGTCVVGEDLGTVPAEVCAEMEDWGMLGMYEEAFHLADRPLPPIPARSVAGLRTHDMPALRAMQESDPASLASYQNELSPPEGDLLDGILDRLIESPAALVQVDLDDLCGVAEPHNLPGQILPTLWSRRLEHPLEVTLADDNMQRRLTRWGARST